jgi:hypothetical protein
VSDSSLKLSRLNRGALQIYTIAKEIARDGIDLQNWVGEMRSQLKRRTHRGRRRWPTRRRKQRVYLSDILASVPKVLVSLPEPDLQVIDAAARKAGETRSSFLRRAALAEAKRMVRPLDDPKTRRAYARLLRNAERRAPMTTAEALAARDRRRR